MAVVDQLPVHADQWSYQEPISSTFSNPEAHGSEGYPNPNNPTAGYPSLAYSPPSGWVPTATPAVYPEPPPHGRSGRAWKIASGVLLATTITGAVAFGLQLSRTHDADQLGAERGVTISTQAGTIASQAGSISQLQATNKNQSNQLGACQTAVSLATQNQSDLFNAASDLARGAEAAINGDYSSAGEYAEEAKTLIDSAGSRTDAYVAAAKTCGQADSTSGS